MRRDPILMGALRARQRPTSQLTWNIEPDDDTDPAQAEASKLVTKVIESIPKFQKMKLMLLEGIWFGKYAVELAYEWKMYKGREVLFVRDFIPINGDKIRYKWDGTPGVLVYPGYPGEKVTTDYGFCHFVTQTERHAYIFHEHEPDDSDWTEPELAGAIHGVGVRGRLYWFWWLKQQIMAQLMNFLKRYANGLTIFYYNASDPAAKAEAEQAARAQWNSNAMLFPRWNSEKPDVNKVERLEVGTASPALLENLVTEYFDNVMVQYILGQTLSSGTASTGMGSGVAALHENTLDEIIKYDAVDLAETLQTDLVQVLYDFNCPGVPYGKFTFEIDSPNSEELMGYAQALYEMGVPLDEDQVYKVSQWQKPRAGNGIVTNVGQMSPAAVEGVPQGVPVAGQAGPPEQVQGQEGAPPPTQYRRESNGKLGRKVVSAGLPLLLARKLPKRRIVIRQ